MAEELERVDSASTVANLTKLVEAKVLLAEKKKELEAKLAEIDEAIRQYLKPGQYAQLRDINKMIVVSTGKTFQNEHALKLIRQVVPKEELNKYVKVSVVGAAVKADFPDIYEKSRLPNEKPTISLKDLTNE